jgi:hypothetical protein
MSKIYDVLEEQGLVSSEQVEAAFRKWSLADAIAIRDEILGALEEDKQDSKSKREDISADEFKFFASSSIRGDYGCQTWGCRVAKAADLVRYAALYCDKVIIPISLDRHVTQGEEDTSFKFDLAGSILCLQEFRPASEAGVLRLVPDELYFCAECAKAAAERYANSERSVEDFLLQNQTKFSMDYVPAGEETPLPLVEVRGPDELLEHGRLLAMYRNEPAWVSDLGSSGPPRRRYSLSPLEVEKTGIVRDLLHQLAADAAFQQIYTANHEAKYLTSLPAQAQAIEIASRNRDAAQRVASLLTAITHSVPILNELPTSSTIRIRREDPEAFLRYRSALGRILSEYVETERVIGASEAREIYADILLPEILRLRAKAKSHRESKLTSAIKKCTFSALVVTVGLFGGLPASVALALKAAGATNLLRDVHDAVSETPTTSSQIKDENLYFLVRVLEEAE